MHVSVLNTVIGYGVIFGALYLGLSPYISNFIGYGVGLVCSFYLTKTIVFPEHQGRYAAALKFLIAFAVAWCLNLLVLHTVLLIPLNVYVAQIVAGIAYSSCMYFMASTWVFK